MAGRRPGPAPKNPEDRARTNSDPLVGRDGWTEIADAPFDGAVPDIPGWAAVGEVGTAIYAELSKLPQARLWGPGTWIQLHLALPLIERYLKRPGSENFKAIVSTLGAGLRLTEDDLQKARVRVKAAAQIAASSPEAKRSAAVVTDIQSRRKRLTEDAS